MRNHFPIKCLSLCLPAAPPPAHLAGQVRLLRTLRLARQVWRGVAHITKKYLKHSKVFSWYPGLQSRKLFAFAYFTPNLILQLSLNKVKCHMSRRKRQNNISFLRRWNVHKQKKMHLKNPHHSTVLTKWFNVWKDLKIKNYYILVFVQIYLTGSFK